MLVVIETHRAHYDLIDVLPNLDSCGLNLTVKNAANVLEPRRRKLADVRQCSLDLILARASWGLFDGLALGFPHRNRVSTHKESASYRLPREGALGTC